MVEDTIVRLFWDLFKNVVLPLMFVGWFIGGLIIAWRENMSFGKMKADTADKYFSLFIRTRDNWTCQRCGKKYEPPTSALHCSHFIGRRKESTRFDPLNADALCFGCHQFFTSNPQEHQAWQIERKGQNEVSALIIRSNSYKKKDRKMETLIWRQALKDLI